MTLARIGHFSWNLKMKIHSGLAFTQQKVKNQ